MDKLMSENKIKVAHITTVHIPNDNRIFHKYVHSLCNRKEVELHYVHREVEDESWKDSKINGLFVDHQLKVNMSSRILRSISGNVSVMKWSLRNKMDIYHLHDTELLFSSLLLKLFRKKVVFDVHENIMLQAREKFSVSDLKSKFTYSVCKKILNLTSRLLPFIYAESSYKKSFLHTRRSIDVLNYPKIQLPLPESQSKPVKFTFIYLGTLTRERGCYLVLEAFNKFNREFPNSGLKLVGFTSREIRESLERHVSDNDIRSISIEGFVDPGKVPALLSTSHVGFSVLFGQLNYRESIPTKNYDYIKHGLLTITSNFDLYRETFGDMALYADPESVESVYRAMKESYENYESHYATLIEKRDKFLAMCNWESQIPSVIGFYHDILGVQYSYQR